MYGQVSNLPSALRRTKDSPSKPSTNTSTDYARIPNQNRHRLTTHTPLPQKHPTTAGEGPGVRARGREGPKGLPIHQHTRRDSPNNHHTKSRFIPKSRPSRFKPQLAVKLPFQRQVCSNFLFHQNPQILRKPPSHKPQTPIPTSFLTLHPESHHKTPRMRTCRPRDTPAARRGNFRQDRGKNSNFPNPQNRSPKPDP